MTYLASDCEMSWCSTRRVSSIVESCRSCVAGCRFGRLTEFDGDIRQQLVLLVSQSLALPVLEPPKIAVDEGRLP